MKKIAILFVFFFLLVSSAFALSLSKLQLEQKEFYASCIADECIQTYTKTCGLHCLEKSVNYTAAQAWCIDPDGKNYFFKSTVTSSIYPQGKTDSCSQIAGKMYLFEGMCINNTYKAQQKTCNKACSNGSCIENNPPFLDLIFNQEVFLGETISFTLTATDADNDNVTYAGKLPLGSTVNKKTGEFVWTPAKEQVGTHTLFFKVSDGYDTDKKNMTILVKEKINSFEDFSSGTLDVTKWYETTDHENWPLLNEHFVDINESAYHTQHKSASNAVIVLHMIHNFTVGENLSFTVNYKNGSGNCLSRFSFNNLFLDLYMGTNSNGYATTGDIGYWNGKSEAGNELGMYAIQVQFKEAQAIMMITSPSQKITIFSINQLQMPLSFAVSTRTGHDGTCHFDYDSFLIKK